MLIRFEIEYKTWMGQQMMIAGSFPGPGGGLSGEALPMQYAEGTAGVWFFLLEAGPGISFSYRYYLRDGNYGLTVGEWGQDREYTTGSGEDGLVFLRDRWRSMADPGFVFHTAAFTHAVFRPAVVFAPAAVAEKISAGSVRVRFRPYAPRAGEGLRVAVCGSTAGLGNWNTRKALLLGNSRFPAWYGEVAVPLADFPLRYKYGLCGEGCDPFQWEQSVDRVLALPDGEPPRVLEVNDESYVFPGDWKGAGVAIPVFSLRREGGFGVGEFSDLKLLADWAAKTGLKMIQVLPVNDTVARHTWQDSYPYAAISVFALHPLYVNLLEIGKLNSGITRQIIAAQGAYLNSLPKIDYEAVMALKSRYFKLIYDQQKREFLSDPDFCAFFEANRHWLEPYAAFSYLRDLFNTPDFTRWDGFSTSDPAMTGELTDPSSAHYDDIAVHYFIQYHAHRQLKAAAEYARSRGVVLKGDIPIGIFRNSVDAWTAPGLYNMDCQAGAPPDDFSASGQNWRFPTYNWEAMGGDRYGWWRKRLRHLSDYFDAFRIDHILGFFRIWEIPAIQVQGLMGYFNPSIPYSREEILAKGIAFDENRYCKPYIREHFLGELFGDLAAEVKSHFLEEYAPGCFRLIAALDNQQKIEQFCMPNLDDDADRRAYLNRLQQGLFALAAEVLFLEAPGSGGQAWFPRNSFHFTHSFRELDPHTRYLLDQLYIDYFYHRNEDYWRGKALQKLPAVKTATDMMLCGEDLGMVPACVPSVMKELGILSLEVQRMPKDPKVEFGHPVDYPYLSVATPSSHDTSTLRGWWEEDPPNIQRFYNHLLGNQGPAPAVCTPDIVRQILLQHLWSPSMWTVFPLQDLLGMDENLRHPDPHAERINQPANPTHYWRYRMHLSLEQLLLQDDFNARLRNLLAETGRI